MQVVVWLRKDSVDCGEEVELARRLWGKLVCKKVRDTVIYRRGFVFAEIAAGMRRRDPIEGLAMIGSDSARSAS